MMVQVKHDVDKLISLLIKDLNPRQRDVLFGRYGLSGSEPMTLAKIGGKYNVTRERIRQIESLSLNSVRAKFTGVQFNDLVNTFKKAINRFGGLRKESQFYNDLKNDIGGGANYENKLKFLLESSGVFYHYPEDKNFYSFWYLDNKDIKKAENFINKVISFVKNKKEQIIVDGDFNNLFVQVVKSINCRKDLAANYLALSKNFSTNAFNDFGLSHWTEICPKTSRDWAYLVLKKHGQPLHFTQLTKEINGVRNNKRTNPQTVHNELIKDNRFVLVGRGVYGLKEFNLMAGTAREVICQILKKHGPQDSKSLVQLVLSQRMFKENTLLLNLQDRDFFQRLENGKYTVKKV